VPAAVSSAGETFGAGWRMIAAYGTPAWIFESNPTLLAPFAERTLVIERGDLSEQGGAPGAA
jgi:hypothetical protein